MADNNNKLVPPGMQSTQQPQRKGTGFTNLSRILQASQGSKLGQTVAGGITGQAQQVQSGINQAQQQFQQEAEQKRIDTAENKKKVGSAINAAVTSGEVNPDDINLFQQVKAGEYKGPTQLANQQQLQAQAQQVQSLGNLASGIGDRSGTKQGGRQELLNRFVGGTDYTSGQRKLDESILAKQAGPSLAAAARQTRGIGQQAEQAGAMAQAQAQQYSNLAKIFSKETADQITAAQEPISSDLNTRVAEAQKKETYRKDFLQKIQDQMNTNEYKDLSADKKTQKLKEYLSQLGPAQEGTQNLGYLTQDEIDSLVGEKGFLSQAQRDVLQNQKVRDSYAYAKKVLDDYSGDSGEDAWYAASGGLRGVDPYLADIKGKDIPSLIMQSLAPGISGGDISAQNISRSGLVDDKTLAKLNALSSLQLTQPEFSQDRQRYSEGDVGALGSLSMQKSIAQSRVDNATQNMNNLNRILELVNRGDVAYGKYPKRVKANVTELLKQYKQYADESKQTLQNLKDIEDRQKK